MKLTKGRPDNYDDRIKKEKEVYELLDNINIEYYYIDHKPLMNMDECKKVEKILGAMICKNVFLCNRQMTNFYLLMMPGDKKFITKDISKKLGCSRLSFAKEDMLLKYLNISPGSVSILGLMNDKENNVKLIIDKEILRDDYIGVHPCINTSTLKIKTEELLHVFLNDVKHDYIVI